MTATVSFGSAVVESGAFCWDGLRQDEAVGVTEAAGGDALSDGTFHPGASRVAHREVGLALPRPAASKAQMCTKMLNAELRGMFVRRYAELTLAELPAARQATQPPVWHGLPENCRSFMMLPPVGTRRFGGVEPGQGGPVTDGRGAPHRYGEGRNGPPGGDDALV